MEIVVVMLIIGLMAAMVAPRVVRYREPPMTELRRATEELSDRALSGVSVRLRQEPPKDGKRGGPILVEALVKDPDSLMPSPELTWKPLEVKHPPSGENWVLEPEIVYFYSDGSCTPARIRLLNPGDSEGTMTAHLTVTGYLFQPDKK